MADALQTDVAVLFVIGPPTPRLAFGRASFMRPFHWPMLLKGSFLKAQRGRLSFEERVEGRAYMKVQLRFKFTFRVPDSRQMTLLKTKYKHYSRDEGPHVLRLAWISY